MASYTVDSAFFAFWTWMLNVSIVFLRRLKAESSTPHDNSNWVEEQALRNETLIRNRRVNLTNTLIHTFHGKNLPLIHTLLIFPLNGTIKDIP